MIATCLSCLEDRLTSFPIMTDEIFTFDHDEKKVIELDLRKKRNNH